MGGDPIWHVDRPAAVQRTVGAAQEIDERHQARSSPLGATTLAGGGGENA
jgi:hypothetical protein